MSRWIFSQSVCVFCAALLTPPFCAAEELKSVSPEAQRVRGPQAITKLDSRTAVVANRCGSVSVVDLVKWTVVSEFEIGGRLTDIASSGRRVFVTDSERSRLVELKIDQKSAKQILSLIHI